MGKRQPGRGFPGGQLGGGPGVTMRLAAAASRHWGVGAAWLVLACLLATPAAGQVSTDDRALDQLAPTPATPATPATAAVKPRHPHTSHAAPAHAAPTRPRLTAPRLPAAPPANPVIQPPAFTMPAHKPPPPPPVPVRADAPGLVLPLDSGTRITFGPGGSDLNPATLAAVQGLAARAVANPALIVQITAWAPSPADDPSTARRLSLDRALAARAVMIQAGVVSDRIRAVAKGALDIGQASADRADITLVAPGK